MGAEMMAENEYKSAKFKQYKESIKIQIHKQIQKYKELCRKQYKHAENQTFKYQIQEYEQNQRIGSLEERLERQQDELNRQANQ